MDESLSIEKIKSKAYNTMQRQLPRFVKSLERSGRIQRPPTLGPVNGQ
jgi:hypothetical protein